jgi:hypothetical protein
LRWLVGGLWLLVSCVEPARSADVPPELVPRVTAVAASTMAKAQASDSASAQGTPQAAQAALAAQAATQAARDAPAAAQALAAPQPVVTPVPVVIPTDAPAPPAEAEGFFGAADGPLRQALSREAPMRIEKGRGGRSLGFKITLESGRKAYFKGEQSFSAANWFGEVAAFHLDRMLGFGRVPTVISRQFPWSRLEPAAGKDSRKGEMIIRNGQVRGAFVAWVDEGVKPLTHIDGWERWIRVRFWPSTAITPFQRPSAWKWELDQVRRKGNEYRSKEERLRRRNLKPEPDTEDRRAEMSDLIVFDYLTRNIDRWGGDNGNVLVRSDTRALVFLDNGAGFEPGDAQPTLMDARLHVLQRFRRSTIEAIRAFDIKRFEQRLAEEPVQPVLNREQLNGLEQRRKSLLAWVAEMEAEHGEAIWAWE